MDPDFSYSVIVNHTQMVYPSGKTTIFHAYFTSDPSKIMREDQFLKQVRSYNPISPLDLQDEVNFNFDMAIGIAGEISPKTLEKMLAIYDVVLVDI
ncbi:unnamed protein product [Lactuca virosa]|uniref:Uncharacterized protein n=1 Tax=Lactuca virosa TaxID=75947 RepID=A0AAU9P9K4_9ASTR|nr:unnamed protein product [Lactuca virosa]